MTKQTPRESAMISSIVHEQLNAALPRRIKRITSHVGLSRYMNLLDTTMLVTPRIAAIPSPYAYSPTHTIYQVKGANPRHVIIIETAHKQYDVFDASNLPLQLAEVE